MAVNHPISYFHFCYLTYGQMPPAPYYGYPYVVKNNKDPEYLFYFKGKWRRMECVKIGKVKKSSYCPQQNIVLTHLVNFSGLTKTREINVSTRIPYSYKFDYEAICEDRWYGQKNGPDIKEGMFDYSFKEEDFDANETFNVNWSTDFDDKDWNGRWETARRINRVQGLRNKNFDKISKQFAIKK